MPTLLLMTSAALTHALQEQLRLVEGWQVTGVSSLTGRQADFLIAEYGSVPEADLRTWQQSAPDAITLLVGPWPETVPNSEVVLLPVRLGYLLARLGHHARLNGFRRTLPIPLGSYQFLPREQKVLAPDETIITLSDKESELLELLCHSLDKLHRQDILREVWGYDGSLDTHTLETHIYRLRRKLPLPNDQELFLVSQGHYQLNPALRTA
jgi:hypothetical protein